MPKKAGNAALADINAIGEREAARMGFELLEAAFEKEPTGLYLRFYLDKEAGVSLDDCEAFHRAVQPLMEKYDYDFMEVCSPGIDRPIRTERDAARCMGQQVEVRLYKPKDGKKVYTGILTDFDNGDITLKVNDEEIVFIKKEIAIAKCVIDMDEVENVDLSDEGKDE